LAHMWRFIVAVCACLAALIGAAAIVLASLPSNRGFRVVFNVSVRRASTFASQAEGLIGFELREYRLGGLAVRRCSGHGCCPVRRQ
jgi:hypothetical protein